MSFYVNAPLPLIFNSFGRRFELKASLMPDDAKAGD
jgi:hypothetical protein